MGLLNDFLSSVDNIKRKSIRSLLDAIENPQDFAAMTAARINEDRYGGAEQYKSVKDKAMKRPYDPAMYQQAMDTMQKQLVNDGLGAITVWHGSPHKFNKFDMSKIGTGEGAQAYGHGLYMAESPKVAGEYAAANQGRAAVHSGDIDSLPKQFQMEAYKALQMKDGPFKQATIDDINERLAASGVAKTLSGGAKQGSLYKVDIPDEAVSRFLDWDNPLSEEMRQPLSKALMDKFGSGVSMGSGEQVYKQVLDEFKYSGHPDPKNAAIQWMSQNGVPGIRYLDGGSRGQQAGTSNFVLFDDQMPRILEINGVPTGNKPWAAGEWKGLLDDTPKRPLTEFEQRHLTAQKNAALPVEQGGLGLPADNTAMDRARAMGAVDFYHGTTADVPAFDLKYYGSDGVAYKTPAIFGSTDTVLSSDYALNKFDREISDAMRNLEAHKRANPGVYDDTYEKLRSDVSSAFKSVSSNGRPEAGGGANVMPLMAMGNFKNVDANGARFMQAIPENLSSAKSDGFDGVRFSNVIDNASPATDYPSNVYAVFNPANIRSRFAAFDPMRRHEADLLGYADPSLLSLIAGGGLLGLGGYSLVDK